MIRFHWSSSQRDDDGQRSLAGSVARPLAMAMEALVLAMVCVSPWALGSVGAEAEFWLFAAIALLLLLWAVRIVVTWQVAWRPCPVAICLAAIIILGIVQLAPLSRSALTWISPGTARIYERLLPSEPEVLPSGQPREPLAVPGGSTISLYPDATRKSLIRLLAIFSLFVIVRNNLGSADALRRLSIALLVNGAALSLFGMIQFFSTAEAGNVYWTIPSSGTPFGPFINRNHFAYYINPCIGLTLGLLLIRSHGIPSGPRDEPEVPLNRRLTNAVSDLLVDPTALWIGGGLTLMFCSVALCLSRGGYIALLGASTACGMLILLRGRHNLRLFVTLLSVSAALAMLIWFGLETIEARLATLWTGDAMGGDRVFLLTHAWRQIIAFPVWGTGYGTFQFVEPLQLHTAKDVGVFYEHAHNDYLEDLVDGGVLRLLIRLLAIGLIVRYASRAYRQFAGTPLGAMALGLLFAFTSIVIHSFFEFGLYIPAIAVLATVLIAHVCSLGECAARASAREVGENASDASNRDSVNDDGDPQAVGLWKAAPLVVASFAAVLGYFFYREGSTAATIRDLRSEARSLRRAAYAGTTERATEIPLLQAVVNLDPNDAERRFVLCEAHFEVSKQLANRGESASEQTDAARREHLTAALRHVLAARDLCPLLPAPHTRIAFFVDALASADPRSAYLERAKFLAPADPQLWYLCGVQEMADQQPQRAMSSWQRSLQLSDRYLTRILDRAATVLSREELMKRVLPDRPEILLAAAWYLYPEPEATLERQPLLQRGLALSEKQTEAMDSASWKTRAMLYFQLDQPTKAIEAYRSALVLDPQQAEWRYELAKMLHDQERQQESRRELRIILSQNPDHPEARGLMQVLAKEAAERQRPGRSR